MPYYIAYGSNLHPLRLQQRLGRVIPAARLQLEGFALRFHKRGGDNSAKVDLVRSKNETAEPVFAALYQLETEQLDRLDRFEGGYQRTTLQVELPGGDCVGAITYCAEQHRIDPALKPFDWYLGLIRAGSEALDFSEEYQRWLAAIARRHDDDQARADEQHRLIEALRRHDAGHLQRLPWGRVYSTSTIS